MDKYDIIIILLVITIEIMLFLSGAIWFYSMAKQVWHMYWLQRDFEEYWLNFPTPIWESILLTIMVLITITTFLYLLYFALKIRDKRKQQ